MPKTLDVDLMPSGTHTDAFGSESTTDLSRLEAIAESYDPEIHKASVIVGHSSDASFMNGMIPSDKLPAYGWVDRLYVDEAGVLHGLIEFVDEAIDWIERKLFDYRSIGLYGDESPYNPMPGQPYMRHVALLGAQPPAIKGLRPLSDIAAEAYAEQGVTVMTVNVEAFQEDDEMRPEDQEVAQNVVDGQPPVADGEVEEPEAMQEEQEMPEAEAPAEGEEGEMNADQFLDENAAEFLRFILADGENGYQGEITRFEPEPTADNDYLWDADEQKFSGMFADESMGEAEMFEFEMKQSGDAWEVSYIPANAEEGAQPTENTAAPTDPATAPAEDSAQPPEDEEPTAMGEKSKALMEDDDKAYGEKAKEDESYGEGKKPEAAGEGKKAYGEKPKDEDDDEAYGEKSKDDKAYSELIAERDALRAQLEQRQVADLKQFIGGVFAEGKLVPGIISEEHCFELANALRKSGMATVVAYSEGEASVNALQAFQELLTKLPVQVAYGDTALADSAPVRTQKEMKTPRGAVYSESGMELHNQILAYAESNELDATNPADYRKAARAVALQGDA